MVRRGERARGTETRSEEGERDRDKERVKRAKKGIRKEVSTLSYR
jgi:hypothetical protein